MSYGWGLIPLAFGTWALRTNFFPLKAGVTLSCIFIAGLKYWTMDQIPLFFWTVMTGFAFSILGDFFLSFQRKHSSYYLWGVVHFGAAHVCYLIAAVFLQSSFHFPIFAVLLSFYTTYFFFRLQPNVSNKTLSVALYSYIVLSCTTTAVSAGVALNDMQSRWFLTAVILILLSDTCIAEADFVRQKGFGRWILPTYYAAHISLLFSLLQGV